MRFLAIPLILLLAGVGCGGSTEDDSEQSETLSKEDVRKMSGKSDNGTDLCEEFGFYGDGACDEFCPKPDPDCIGSCETDDDCPEGSSCQPNLNCAGLDCPTNICMEQLGCGDGSLAVCEVLPRECPDGLVREVVNGCFGECVDPDTCEPPDDDPPVGCGDGSLAVCEVLPRECPDGLVREVVNGCFGECVDPHTCEPPADDDDPPNACDDGSLVVCEITPPECPDGLVPEVANGCWGECVDPDTCEAPPLCGGLLGVDCGTDAYCDFPTGDACSFADGSGLCVPRPEICTADVDPVCGCDGETYNNACAANRAGTDVAHAGGC